MVFRYKETFETNKVEKIGMKVEKKIAKNFKEKTKESLKNSNKKEKVSLIKGRFISF